MTPAHQPRQPDAIETERLTLRRFAQDDAPAIAAALSDREMSWTLGRVPHPYGLEDARDYLRSLESRSNDVHAVCLRAGKDREGPLVGSASIAYRVPGCTDEGEGERAITLGYWIAREHWGQGYASEAVAGKLFEHFARGGGTVLARAFADNPASLRVLRHVGFRVTGEALDTNLVRGGAFPVRLHECTADDFRGAAWNMHLAPDEDAA